MARRSDAWESTFTIDGSTYRISTDPAEIDRDLVHRFLHDDSYWAAGVPRAVLDRAIDNSLSFGAYDEDGRQVAFGRVVTDGATFAWLADVFVVADLRGKGIGRFLVAAIVSHPDLQGLRWFLLATRDAHGLYRRFGFEDLTPERASRLMAVWRSSEDLYRP
ncbi:MAG TPA: GNAT family N-acetyltransferase [Actinomycetota bacterium]|nr:GNAT family N-acetyltransferase [Actinomycetota bacterium]